MILASVRASALGIVAACVAVALFAALSGFVLSERRLSEVVRTAVTQNELDYAARTDEDFFTECAVLEMQHLRRGGIFLGAFDTRFLMRPGEHSCDSLRKMMLGSAEEKASLPAAVSYYNYPFGSRHLEAFVLSVLDYGPATLLYRVLSYGSLALLLVVMLRRASATAIVLAPISLLLICAFSLHRFGGNLAHAPGYFVGFIALAVFVGTPRWFHNVAARLGFAGALGVAAAYFDLLNGVIVTLLALTILLNHFFYVTAGRERRGYLLTAATQGVAIFACFLSACLAVTASRLGLLWLNGVDVSAFVGNLLGRTGSDVGKPEAVDLLVNLEALFDVRYQLTPGGAGVANWIFLAGIAGWIFVGLAGLATLAYRRALRMPALVDVLVLAAVSIGILIWYWSFAAHTYVHILFMVRLLAIPLACGLAAALLAVHDARRDRLPVGALLAALCIALPLSALILHKRWTNGTAPSEAQARFVDARADLVSCIQFGLSPDGQPDGVIEIRFRKTTPPLSYLGLRAGDQAHIQLIRRDPIGVYHTGYLNNILGIAREPGGILLNARIGTFSFAAGGEQRVYAHFCRDGDDKPDSTYELKIDGVALPIAPP